MERLFPTEHTTVLALLEGQLSGWKRSTLKERLRDGLIEVNGRPVRRHDTPLAPGDEVSVLDPHQRPKLLSPGAGLVVRYEDNVLIAVDKPAGLLAVATEAERERTVLAQVREALARDRKGRGRVWPVHRIDRGTSGLLLVAKSREVREAMQAGWAEVEKVYLAIVEGAPAPPASTIRKRLREGKDLKVYVDERSTEAKDAVTHYRTLEVLGSRALLEVRLETGRKHQIRAHLASLGYPIAGDTRYGAASLQIGRPALHAHRLRFPHPVTGAVIELVSPLPRDLERLVTAERPGLERRQGS